MKIRTIAAYFVVLTAPGTLVGFGPHFPLGPSVVAAAESDDTQLARERFRAGVEAYDLGKYEQARALFEEAYALKRHPLLLLNLGQSELKSGHVAAGGNHLQQFLREYRGATTGQKRDAKRGIKTARTQAGYAIMLVDVDGAELSVDGIKIGTAPLDAPYFVAPGDHQVSAIVDGRTARARFSVKRGQSTTVNLSIPTTTSAATPPPAAAPPSAQPAPTPPAKAPVDEQVPRDFFGWFANTPSAWIGAGVAATGLGLTIGFGIAASGAASAADDVDGQINSEIRRRELEDANGGVDESQPCGDFDRPGTSLDHYRNACDVLRANINARDADLLVMGIGIGATVAGVAGTMIYYFADRPSASSDRATSLSLTPTVSPSAAGLSVSGSF